MSQIDYIPAQPARRPFNWLAFWLALFIVFMCSCCFFLLLGWYALPKINAWFEVHTANPIEVTTTNNHVENDPNTTFEPTNPYADENVMLIGGRLDGNQHGYEYIANANLSYIENGTPLQEYLSQVTDYSFANTLNLESNHEILNDGVQFVIVGDRAYIMPREKTSEVPFWTISYIQYDPNRGVFICSDDSGVPGDWYGGCAGKSMWVTTWMSLDNLMLSDLFNPWVGHFVNTQDMFNVVFNDKIQVVTTFRR